MKQNSSFVAYLLCKFVLLISLFSVSGNKITAQTTIISPTGNGGFETGTTFAANGWTTVGGTATQNVWFCGNGATAGYSGARCAYISNTAGGAYAYTITASRASFMYRNITVPAGESNIALTFKWLNQGESSFDKIRVWVVPTTFTPTSGTAITASGTAPTGNIQIGGNFSVQGTWTTANLALPTAYAGTTVRLVFEWTNDASGGTQPPGAIDDISLVSAVPTAPCSYSSTSSSYWISNVSTTGGFTNINNATAYSAGGYGDYYASQVVSQIAGGTVNFNITMSSSTHGINIYVDWNNDFDFADAGEKVYASGGYVSGATSSFAIPGAQANGNYRMRIVSHFLNTDPPACSSETYTEAEDYRIQVTPPPTCYAPTVSANASSTTAGSATWTPPVLGTVPVGYEYVISTTNALPGGAGTPIAGTSTTFTGLTPNTTYYVFVRSNCGAGDFSAWGASSFYTGYCPISSSGGTYYTNDFSTLGGTTNITNNGSGFSAGGYGNFTAQTVTQAAGGTVSFSAAITGGTAGFGIWIDWNNDLDFNDPGEDVYISNAFVSTATGYIVVPAGAAVGNHRMRVVTNGSITVPSACGSGTSLEAEDYTFVVATPPACSGIPTGLSVFIVSMTSSTISWNAATPAPANGYQYYYNTTGVVPTGATVPSGSVGAGITSVTLTGLTAGTKYYVWVRSNCGAGNQGTWVGVLIYTQPTCAVGPGTGTTTLGCPTSVSGGLGLSGAPAPPINCSTSACANLEVTYSPIKDTSSYTVSSIPYAPPYQFNCMRNPVSVNADDVWSPVVNLPFNFCFYGNTYNQCVIGSNGVITFDTSRANTASGYSFANDLPSTTGALFANAIYGVYHDIDPRVAGGEVGYELITLNTGCRALVVSYNNVAMFSDNTLKYTGMMVLYENTNIIDVYIKNKVIDGTWNGGNAIVGLQNATGTAATVAPGRNGLSTDWTATNEAWRFTPNGANVPTTITWYEGAGTTGPVVGNTATISVCPTATTTYTAEVTYTLCNGLTHKLTAQTPVTVSVDKTWNGSVSTNWAVANNWTPSGVPLATHSVTIPNVANAPIVSSNVVACSIAVQNGGVLTINSGSSIVVTNGVNVAPTGNFIINNTGSLVQINNVANTGNIQHVRSVSMRRQDYTYWSSPVASFPVTSISTGTNAGYIYKWLPTTATAYTSAFGNWTNANENMVLGKGYIVRGPDAYSLAVPATFTSTIVGTPNNGVITTPISRSTFNGANYTYVNASGSTITVTKDDDNWNLIGNPYPSALNADKFLTTNTNISGFVKLWTHGTLPSAAQADPFYGDFVYNYTPADYHTYNLGGTNAGPGTFNGNIASGQGFFVLMNNAAATPGTISFDNTMRRDASNLAYNNTNFFKNGSIKTSKSDKNRIWLDLINANNNSNIRTLVGYMDGATNESDRLYDAITDEKLNFNVYSILKDEMFTIQGKSLPFVITDKISLGISVPQSGSYKIAIGAVDGLFSDASQTIFLEDKSLNIIHDLRSKPYSFTANQGRFNDRFVLRYTDRQLSAQDYENSIKVYASNVINVESTTEKIKDVTVYDIIGKKLIDLKNIQLNEISINELKPTTDVLLVKVILENGTTITKKVIY